MAYFNEYIETEIELELSPREIFNSLSDSELIELNNLIMGDSKGDRAYTLSNMCRRQTDTDILTNKRFLDMFIKLLKYETSDYLDYVIEELNYNYKRN